MAKFFDGSTAARAIPTVHVKTLLEEHRIPMDKFPGEAVKRFCDAIDQYITGNPFIIDLETMWRMARVRV